MQNHSFKSSRRRSCTHRRNAHPCSLFQLTSLPCLLVLHTDHRLADTESIRLTTFHVSEDKIKCGNAVPHWSSLLCSSHIRECTARQSSWAYLLTQLRELQQQLLLIGRKCKFIFPSETYNACRMPTLLTRAFSFTLWTRKYSALKSLSTSTWKAIKHPIKSTFVIEL